LAIRKALDSEEIKPLIDAAKSISIFLKRSPKAQRILMTQQRAQGKKVLSMVVDNKTRWDSAFQMLDRLYASRGPISATLVQLQDYNRSKPPADLTPSEWANVGLMAGVLQHLERRYKFIAEQKHPTIGMAAIVIEGTIKTHLAVKQGDTPLIASLKTIISKEITKSWETVLRQVYDKFLLAAFLDPRVKDFRFVSNLEERQQLQKAAEAMARDLIGDTTCNLLQAQVSSSEFWDSFQDLLSFSTDLPSDELVRYQAFACYPLATIQENVQVSTDPLTWWRENGHTFPNLAKLAKRFLCITATSMPCERAFSLAGLLVNKRRCGLSDKNLSLLLFLACNKCHW
jgi:hypothetical protein